MSHGTGETVDCALCGEPFDPTVAGGWCTNPDWGQWQYEDVEVGVGPADAAETADDTAAADPAADNFCANCGEELDPYRSGDDSGGDDEDAVGDATDGAAAVGDTTDGAAAVGDATDAAAGSDSEAAGDRIELSNVATLRVAES